jgi:hypothetical protein
MAIEVYGIDLSDLVSIAALAVSLLTASILFIGHIKRTRSEQFRFSLEIWDRIAAKNQLIDRWNKLDDVGRQREGIDLENVLEALRRELQFFVFLTEKGEINKPNVLEYYRKASYEVLAYVVFLKNKYPDTDYHSQYIISLIEKYHKAIGNMKEFSDHLKRYESNVKQYT